MVGDGRTPLRFRGVIVPAGEVRDVYVAERRVTFEPVAGARTVAGEGWLVPGLVDAHCHVGLGPDGAVDAAEQQRQAVTDRDAGTLLIRDCGSPADTRWIDGRDDLPRILRAGRHLARPKRYLRHVGVEIEPDELAEEAGRQARWGDGWVKLVGDWIDRDRGDLAPCWPEEAVAAAVQRAHAAGARVTVHIFGEDGLDELIAAGVDCIEHGTGLSDAQLASMAGRGIALVPTLINIATFPDIAARASRFPRYADHMLALHARAAAMVRTAHDAGVRVYAGTDAGGGIAHGRIADEVLALHEAGLPVDAALGAASWAARSWLRQPAGLAEGDRADFVVYAADPGTEPATLSHPKHVVLGGVIVG